MSAAIRTLHLQTAAAADGGGYNSEEEPLITSPSQLGGVRLQSQSQRTPQWEASPSLRVQRHGGVRLQSQSQWTPPSGTSPPVRGQQPGGVRLQSQSQPEPAIPPPARGGAGADQGGGRWDPFPLQQQQQLPHGRVYTPDFLGSSLGQEHQLGSQSDGYHSADEDRDTPPSQFDWPSSIQPPGFSGCSHLEEYRGTLGGPSVRGGTAPEYCPGEKKRCAPDSPGVELSASQGLRGWFTRIFRRS